ncbi:transketolase [Streptomyces phyllanthi]|uniref:Transketolase n=1 Tax=Streptomyces phyllanthi TaxID=1803180 RepID=A0A5N8VYQ1_9ACTN|nr:transketolase [Streptomyces phyllanthi]MPY39168.1 transketolase [Streptomyces phyllanthi]
MEPYEVAGVVRELTPGAGVGSLSGYEAYRRELCAVAAQDSRVVCLAASPGAVGHPFEAAHPDRFFGLPGIASAMVEVVSGLVAAGFRPFVCTVASPTGPGAAGSLHLRTRYLEAGATVVTPYAGFLEDYAVLRRLKGVALAAPCGDAETRAVLRAAARSDRPFHIRVGDVPVPDWPRADLGPEAPAPVPPVFWEFTGARAQAVCLVSVGEEGVGLARAVRKAAPWLAHAHLVCLDDAHLEAAAGELALRHSKFVVTSACPGAGGVAATLARLLPGREVTAAHGAADRAGGQVTGVLRAADQLAACA